MTPIFNMAISYYPRFSIIPTKINKLQKIPNIYNINNKNHYVVKSYTYVDLYVIRFEHIIKKNFMNKINKPIGSIDIKVNKESKTANIDWIQFYDKEFAELFNFNYGEPLCETTELEVKTKLLNISEDIGRVNNCDKISLITTNEYYKLKKFEDFGFEIKKQETSKCIIVEKIIK